MRRCVSSVDGFDLYELFKKIEQDAGLFTQACNAIAKFSKK